MTQIRSDLKISDFIIKAVGCTSSANVWLRSCNRSNANNAWNVNSSGNVNNNNAYNANRGCPDCFASVKRSTHSADTPKELKCREPNACRKANNTSEMRQSYGTSPLLLCGEFYDKILRRIAGIQRVIRFHVEMQMWKDVEGIRSPLRVAWN